MARLYNAGINLVLNLPISQYINVPVYYNESEDDSHISITLDNVALANDEEFYYQRIALDKFYSFGFGAYTVKASKPGGMFTELYNKEDFLVDEAHYNAAPLDVYSFIGVYLPTVGRVAIFMFQGLRTDQYGNMNITSYADTDTGKFGTFRLKLNSYITITKTVTENMLTWWTPFAPPDPFGPLPVDEPTIIEDPAEFDYESEEVDFPDVPVSVTDLGLVALFNPTKADLISLGQEMWVDTIGEQLKKFLGDITDVIIGLSRFPFSVNHSASKSPVNLGFISTSTEMYKIPNQYQKVDCGSFTLNSNDFTQTYLDYSPYSQVSLYLPYVGMIDLDIDEIINTTIKIEYVVDLFTGSACAMVRTTNASGVNDVLYQFGCTVSTPIPIAARDWNSLVTAIVGMTGAAITGGVFHGEAISKVGGAILGGGISGAESASNGAMKPRISHTGAVAGPTGAMGVQTPYFVFKLPNIHRIASRNEIAGYPNYVTYTLTSLRGKGYTIVEEIHLKDIPANSFELDEIETLLKGGVEF